MSQLLRCVCCELFCHFWGACFAFLAPAPTRLVAEADIERDLSTVEPQLEMDGGDDLTEGCDGENGGSEASAEGPRRGTRCRRATQLYGEPIPSDVT